MALDLSKVAIKLINKLGAKASERVHFTVRESGGVEDPATGEYTPGQTTETPIAGALLDHQAALASGFTLAAEEAMFLSPPNEDIQLSDSLRLVGTDYTIVSLGRLEHAGKLQLYQIKVKSQ